MKQKTALRRETDGLLSRITIYESDAGWHIDPMDAAYEIEALIPNGEHEELKGWGEMDGYADIYETDAGIEILIPRQDEEIKSLDGLCEAMRKDDPRFLDQDGRWVDPLPIFGGEEPADTMDIGSWDETRLLVGTCAQDLQIVARKDWRQSNDHGKVLSAGYPVGLDNQDDHCPDCGVSAEYRYCDNCPNAGYVIDCGHYAQPRPIASVGHKMLCTRCAKQKPLFPEQVEA